MPPTAKEKERALGLPRAVSLVSPPLHPCIYILNQHYQSFSAFQQYAMVMGQLIRQRNSRSKRIALPTPRTTFTPLDGQRSLPSSFHELQSDQGYSSSMTSDTRSTRMSTYSGTSSPDVITSVPTTPDSSGYRPSPHDARSTSSPDNMDDSLQGNEVSSSTVGNPRFSDVPALEDPARVSSKLPPLFCEENSYQGVVDIPIDTKLEEEQSISMATAPDYRSKIQGSRVINCDSECEIDYAAKVKAEVDSAVKFMNSDVDVMWAVKPELSSERKSAIVPSPEKWSNDDSSDSSHFHMSSHSQPQYPYSMKGMIPAARSFHQTKPKAKQKSRKQLLTMKYIAPDSMQVEAMDLSLPSKRKPHTPHTENKRKPKVQESENKRTLISPQRENKRKRQRKPKTFTGENDLGALAISEKTIVNVNLPSGMKRVLQVSSEQNQIHAESVSPVRNMVSAAQKKSSNQSGNSIGEAMSKPEKKFACEVCDKRYSQRSSLHTHMRIHTGVRPYACKDCGRSFTDCSTYIKHCRLHTGEKPYACGVCARRFTQSGNMMRHQQKCKGGK